MLEAEVKRWSEKSYDQLRSELAEVKVYEIEYAAKQYQVEVQLLEDNGKYLHVLVCMDDGSIPASFSPLCQSFVKNRPEPNPA